MQIGVDLGGTKIEVIALGNEGEEVFRKRAATPRHDYDGTLSAIGRLVNDAKDVEPGAQHTVGIGTPGSLSKVSGRIKNSNSTWLIDRPLKEDLEKLLGQEVRMANDANCFALSEAVDGAARESRIVFGVILGTGVGGGVVMDRSVVDGPNSISGEWGHNPLPDPWGEDRLCYCGRSNCIETFLSGPGLEKSYVELGGELTGAGGSGVTERAEARDPVAQKALDRYENDLARALGTVINILDPDCIVLGGGVSNLSRLYEAVPQIWTDFVFSDRVDTMLRPPVHGDSGGVRGAAWLWSQERVED